MDKIKKILFYCLAYLSVWPNMLQAQTEVEKPLHRFLNIAQKSSYNITSGQTRVTLIVNIIVYVLGFIGLIFFIMILYSGFQWMASGGNEEKVAEAKKRIANSVIGLAIVLTAYALALLVNHFLNAATANTYR